MMWYFLLVPLLGSMAHSGGAPDPPFRVCEPIRIEMCRGIGYNETSMPNLVGLELQSDVELTLSTFAPLIQYVCSTQLKFFLCAAYVPMCTPKVPVPIGPCRSLCESVRARCHPVLEGFGFSWNPVLDCSRFPKENNHETMCMEGPGETRVEVPEVDDYHGLHNSKMHIPNCPGLSKSHIYFKGSCVLLCEADYLFTQNEKHLAEMWVATWAYAALGLAIVATLCMILGNNSKNISKWPRVLTPLVWCHDMVVIGFTVRFVSGRNATACGYDPQLPSVPLLLVDGLSNASCAATFILRYYFGMAACAWWSILCLGWHRDVRRNSLDCNGHTALGSSYNAPSSKQAFGSKKTGSSKKNDDITHNNLACFTAWALPAFQTAAVIVARLVDADELLGACFVGNQSDKGLQIFVATPLFCYWIFGAMNLVSGYLVHRRNVELMKNLNIGQQRLIQSRSSGIGTFLFFYCTPYALLLMAVIYEFVNIDVWLNRAEDDSTPFWPFLMRAFMELMLGIICSSWVLSPVFSTIFKKQLNPNGAKQTPSTQSALQRQHSSRNSHVSYSTVSYQSVRLPQHAAKTLSLNQMSNYSPSRNKCPSHLYVNRCDFKMNPSFLHHGNETIL